MPVKSMRLLLRKFVTDHQGKVNDIRVIQGGVLKVNAQLFIGNAMRYCTFHQEDFLLKSAVEVDSIEVHFHEQIIENVELAGLEDPLHHRMSFSEDALHWAFDLVILLEDLTATEQLLSGWFLIADSELIQLDAAVRSVRLGCTLNQALKDLSAIGRCQGNA